MQIERRDEGSKAVVLVLRGKLLAGGSEETLRNEIAKLDGKGKRVVLDIRDVPSVDPVGLGGFVRAYATVSKAGGTFALAGGTQRVLDLLAITKLLTVFETFESVEDALAE